MAEVAVAIRVKGNLSVIKEVRKKARKGVRNEVGNKVGKEGGGKLKMINIIVSYFGLKIKNIVTCD